MISLVMAPLDLWDGVTLSVAAKRLLDSLEGTPFEVVAGIGPYADAVSHAVAILKDCYWTTLREEAKDHGTSSAMEGHHPLAGERVLLLHDDHVNVIYSVPVADLVSVGADIVAVVTVNTPVRASQSPQEPSGPPGDT